jgi:hypothetical protein
MRGVRPMLVSTSLWGEPVSFDVVEVHVSENAMSRAAILKRTDGLFCVLMHYKLDDERHRLITCDMSSSETWLTDNTPPEQLYQDLEPEPGFYGTIDDARRAAAVLLGLVGGDHDV